MPECVWGMRGLDSGVGEEGRQEQACKGDFGSDSTGAEVNREEAYSWQILMFGTCSGTLGERKLEICVDSLWRSDGF